jgi:hypothetical protein
MGSVAFSEIRNKSSTHRVSAAAKAGSLLRFQEASGKLRLAQLRHEGIPAVVF